MEQFLRQRIDCPPPGGTRTLIEEKDAIIKKQQDELKKLQNEIEKIQNERDHLLSLLCRTEEKIDVDPPSNSSGTTTTIVEVTNTCSINQYELSQDLHDKQLEILERKYGGNLRCRRAATIIQRAYRQYKLRENFRHLCATVKTNKRLSCSFLDSQPNHFQIQTLKPLKPCLRIPKKSSLKITPHVEDSSISQLDLPSINFEHFIESETTKNPNTRKRVCIVTEKNLAMDEFDDFDTSNNRKPVPPVRTISLKTRPIVSSPIWKRQNPLNILEGISTEIYSDQSIDLPMSPSSTTSSDRDSLSLQSNSSESNSQRISTNSFDFRPSVFVEAQPILHGEERLTTLRLDETFRRRCYRVGLNIFNKKPERGIRYLISHRFLDSTPTAVARFLLSRKGLSRQMIGEYLGNLQDPFAMKVLQAFVNEFDFNDMPIDIALRKFQASFRLPGEAQKIEQLMKIFSQRYASTRQAERTNVDTIFILAFAIIMLNTDLHSRNIKAEKKMRLEQFIKNLRAIDDADQLDIESLTGIYERIRTDEFRPDADHVTQVVQFEQNLTGKKLHLVASHRRLVCYCRFYEIYDVNKRDKLTSHQREVYLFNDLLVITKISGKKHQQFREAFRLSSMKFYLFETSHYHYGIRLVRKINENECHLITFNARNEHDRRKFSEDLKESIFEVEEMEAVRIQWEFEKVRFPYLDQQQKQTTTTTTTTTSVLSSLIDFPPTTIKRDRPLSRTLSNSLLDMTLTMSKNETPFHHVSLGNQPFFPYRSSQCSLDSGMVSLINDFSPHTRISTR